MIYCGWPTLPSTLKEGADLFSSGDLDSMNIIMIASEINDRFDVELRAIDITPENFDSPDGILALIKRLKKEEA